MTAVRWTDPVYETIICLLGERTGLSFAPHRCESAENGIRRSMARAGLTNPDRYRERVATDDRILDDLIVELTVGETYFFREPAQFEFIRHEVLPEIQRRWGHEHVLRVWSAGCASGEEAYSLAMLFEQEGISARTHLLASDISRAALAKARRASYGGWSLRGDCMAVVLSYLHRRGSDHVVDEKIQRRITFEHLNLALNTYPSFATGTWGMDLILCRNVLIYFDRETVRSVARRLFECLAPGGWLITASSDPPLAGDSPYESVVTNAGVFYRRPSVFGGPWFAVGSDREFVRVRGEGIEPTAVQAETPFADLTTSLCAPVIDDGLRITKYESRTSNDPLAEARDAFARGDYVRACELARKPEESPDASVLYVRSFANLATPDAERACAEAAACHPLSTELHYLHAVLLMDLGRQDAAAQAARRVIYLDRSLAIAHFVLGSILSRCGDLTGAQRAYRNARDLCAARPPNEIVPLSDGEHAGQLAEAAAGQLTILEASAEAVS